MLGIYLVFSLGSFAVARTIRGMLETLRFQEFDRHLGAVMGFLKGATLCLILTFFVVTISESAREQVLRRPGGRLAGYLLYRIDGILPRELHGVLAPHFHKIQGELIEIAVEEEQRGKQPNALNLPFDLDPRDDEAQESDSEDGQHGEDLPDAGDAPIAEDAPTPAPTSNTVVQADQLWNNLAGSLMDRLKNQISHALSDTLPLGTAPPSAEGAEGNEITHTKPVQSEGPTTPRPQQNRSPRLDTPLVPRERRPSLTAADDPEVDRLLGEICLAFTGRESTRQQLRRQVSTLLDGVPATLARQALADWRADLYGTLPDPDPGTDIDTPLENRILRQLTKARISLQDLPDGVQSRLKRTR
jgi:membrane protein required for colicin V production